MIKTFAALAALLLTLSASAQIQTIQGTDLIKDSRAVINSNFSYLDTNKLQIATSGSDPSGACTAGKQAHFNSNFWQLFLCNESGSWMRVPKLLSGAGTASTVIPAGCNQVEELGAFYRNTSASTVAASIEVCRASGASTYAWSELGAGSASLPSTSNVLKGNGSGGALAATPGTDYVIPAGNVATATALAGNGTNCSAGQAARGIDASGNAEDCFAPGGSAANIVASLASNTVTVSAGTVGIGNTYATIASETASSPTATGTLRVYLDKAGVLRFGWSNASGLTCSVPSHCVFSVTSFPEFSLPLAQVASSGTTFGTLTSARPDLRRDVVEGSNGILCSEPSGTGITTCSTTASVMQISTGTTVPSSCSATNQYFIDTDAAAGAKFSYCNGSTYESVAGGSSDPNMVTAAGTLTLNAPMIGGGSKAAAVGTASGNTTQFATVTGTKTTGKQLAFDASGNVIASGSDIGGAGGGYPQQKAATCQAGAAASGFNMATTNYPAATCITGTNRVYGVLSFTSGQYVEDSIQLTGTSLTLDAWTRRNGTGSSATATLSHACVATGEDADTAYYASPQTLTFTDAGTANLAVKTTATITLNAACASGERLFWRIAGGATAFDLIGLTWR